MSLQISLIDILKSMLRSALAWEEEHGIPNEVSRDRNSDGLTCIPSRINCVPDGGPSLKLIKGGEEDEPTEFGR